MRRQAIPSLLHQILATTMALSAASCSTIDLSGFEPLPCEGDRGRPNPLADLTPATPFDYAALHGDEGSVVAEVGERCATAGDVAACRAAIDAALPVESGFTLDQCVQVCDDYYLVVNRGDAVEVVEDAERMRAFLGEIDSPSEAVTAARLADYTVGCGDAEVGGVKQVVDTFHVIGTRFTQSCDPVEQSRVELEVDREGRVIELQREVISSESGACIGRRPAAFTSRAAVGRSELGAYFASVTHLEQAAVHAFEELRRELLHHGAPEALVSRARRAAREEVRHVRLMGRLARRFAGTPPRAQVTHRPPRALEDLALHNAVEGCVRETFGALLGLWQAQAAADPEVRHAMREVAADETGHAALSWDIHHWAMDQLGSAARRRVEEAQRRALDALCEPEEPMPEALQREAGLPGSEVQVALAQRFRAALAA
ncbi:MAG: ferritin-like domain-containing protein [Myxococcales bacterium]|nr:ferritin-like domain-containing protein [Myxococcales bacterium]